MNDIAAMKAFFGAIDPKAKIWGLGDKLSPFLPGTVDFGNEDLGISIIDQFSGKQPLLMSRHTLHGESKIGFLPTILLDSNIVSCLHEYRTKPVFRKSEIGQSVRKLLEKFIETGYDYNPVFYFAEAVAKNDLDTLWPYAKEMAATIFTLHSMDEAHFLETDEITHNEEAVSHYLDRFGVSDFSKVPEAFLNHAFCSADHSDLKSTCDGIYAVLLKMILIHLTSRVSIIGKLEQLKSFLDDELGVQMAREFLIAADYFSGNCDRFIPLKKQSKWKEHRPKLMASAWDILLLRIPELLLSQGDHNEVALGYICTAEKALRVISKLFTIKAVSCMPPDVTTPIPMIDYDFSRIEQKFGSHITARIEQVAPSLLNAASNRGKLSKAPKTQLSPLIASLEEQVCSLCA